MERGDWRGVEWEIGKKGRREDKAEIGEERRKGGDRGGEMWGNWEREKERQTDTKSNLYLTRIYFTKAFLQILDVVYNLLEYAYLKAFLMSAPLRKSKQLQLKSNQNFSQ